MVLAVKSPDICILSIKDTH
uniref:Uncharacterized protein n=1 Tax=Anguilla anguilla TaxID=7936 RepID=A0A0E9SJI3_ANGAN